MNLVTIAQSWLMVVKDDPELIAIAEHRLTKCDVCRFKRQLSPAKALIVSLINDSANTFFCGHCGCPLAALTINPKNQCPNDPPLWWTE